MGKLTDLGDFAARSPRIPGAPDHLKADGKKLWRDISKGYELESHDYTILLSLCETVDRKTQAESDLRQYGKLTFENRYGEIRPHPAVNIIRDCNTLIAKLRRELNLSPEPEINRSPELKYK